MIKKGLHSIYNERTHMYQTSVNHKNEKSLVFLLRKCKFYIPLNRDKVSPAVIA